MSGLDLIQPWDDGPRFTRLGMGCWAIGGHGWGKVDDDASERALRQARERGVTFFDTADCYGLGKSERMLRDTFGDGLRSLFVASKGGVRWNDAGRVRADCSPTYLRSAAEASLRRLGLERLPLYYIHKPDGFTPIPEMVGALVRLREEGKIGEIGVSNFSAGQLAEALCAAPVRFVQNPFNLLQRESGLELADLCRRSGIRLVAWGALADGLLSGKFNRETTFGDDDHRSRLAAFQGETFLRNLQAVDALREFAHGRGVTLAQLALRWVLDAFPFTCALFGVKTAAQVDENLGADGWRLAKADMARIDACVGPLPRTRLPEGPR
ncbi:MAG: aldo/keto reductase [Acidobacteria bacterium]|nr:aldo/keto reductase [Acidobacteriota bacterium]